MNVRRAFLALALLLLTACAYRPVYGAEGPAGLHVKLVRTLVPDVMASDEVASGVREELAREGALAAGEGWPRIEIEVLRDDETSEGIATALGAPYARATDIALVARAWIVRSPGAPPERETGDVRATDVVATDRGAFFGDGRAESASLFRTAAAFRAVAHRLGRKLAQRVEGFAGSSEELIDR